MPHIRNAGTAKCVTLNSSLQAEYPGFCGTVSQITWRNPNVLKGLRVMFAAADDEEIVAIELTDEGIKAKFNRLTQPTVRTADGRRR